VENRKPTANEDRPVVHEPRAKLREDGDASAYEAGSRAAREAFGKVAELLIKEKQKRR
jgi:hypothetical protein